MTNQVLWTWRARNPPVADQIFQSQPAPHESATMNTQVRLPNLPAVTFPTPRTGYDQYPSSLWRPSLLPLPESPVGTPHRA